MCFIFFVVVSENLFQQIRLWMTFFMSLKKLSFAVCSKKKSMIVIVVFLIALIKLKDVFYERNSKKNWLTSVIFV